MDHNIFIRNLTNNDSPTAPKEMGTNTSSKGFNNGMGIGSTPTGGFTQDTQVEEVLTASSGKLSTGGAGGVIGLAVITATKKVVQITKEVVGLYNSYSSMSSGNYKFQNDWNNMWQGISNVTNPKQTAISYFTNTKQIQINNAKKEQELVLLGGTVINSNYGRYI